MNDHLISDYFDQYCQLCKTQTTPTASSSTTINHLKPLTLSYISIAWISALSLSVVFVGGAICWICVYRRKHNGLEFNCGCKKRSASQLVLVPGKNQGSMYQNRRNTKDDCFKAPPRQSEINLVVAVELKNLTCFLTCIQM